MSYVVHLKRSAEKELASFPQEVQSKIIKRLLGLKDNPRPTGTKKLGGGDRYRIRVGDYRILYTIDDASQKIEVIGIGPPARGVSAGLRKGDWRRLPCDYRVSSRGRGGEPCPG